MKILQEVERRNGAYPARNWKFESISLQRTVRLLREVARRGREPRLFARVCRPWEVVRSAETGIGQASWHRLATMSLLGQIPVPECQ